ncbi:DNA repair protein [Priestia aryabhattai]|uniref:sporulation membrane protein YtrI n=1 Tax=Priestia TaxID=2800373 RepID=UPI000BA0829D|nr:sporulation membrane protein YtrI [Priestia flexa]MDT2045206.1 DNA repair protein [Priestia flexa]OZT12220.1 DNA repair protein [Priestia aryabhattai]USY54716.1 DNA repair protein [Bacillus sp. 1780r2a1]
MRVPNKRLYKRSDLERFFAGLVIGAIVSWGVFLIIYGELQHEQTKSLVQLEQQLERAEKNSLIWQEDVRELNKKMKKNILIQEVKVNLTNTKQYKLGSLTSYHLQASVEEEALHLIAQDIESAYDARNVLKKAIENKKYEFDKMIYEVEVHQIYFYTTLSIEIRIKKVEKVM